MGARRSGRGSQQDRFGVSSSIGICVDTYRCLPGPNINPWASWGGDGAVQLWWVNDLPMQLAASNFNSVRRSTAVYANHTDKDIEIMLSDWLAGL
jgi:hypothetical protein